MGDLIDASSTELAILNLIKDWGCDIEEIQ